LTKVLAAMVALPVTLPIREVSAALLDGPASLVELNKVAPAWPALPVHPPPESIALPLPSYCRQFPALPADPAAS